jgi:hypothetical protein
MRLFPLVVGAAILSAISLSPAEAGTKLRFTITNLTPTNGGIVTQSALLLHGGDYDIFTLGEFASSGIERIAEDALRSMSEGAPTPGLIDEFQPYAAGHAGGQGLLFDGPTAIVVPSGAVEHHWLSGQTGYIDVEVDPTNPNNAFFSLAFMFVASNDAFWGNDDPTAFRLFNPDGSFNPIDYTVLGSHILDAGTEINDETHLTTAGLGQPAPNLGTPEGGVITAHSGFMAPNGIAADGGVLDEPFFANANFKQQGFQVARISVGLAPAAVPEPASWAFMIIGFGLVGAQQRRRRMVTA